MKNILLIVLILFSVNVFSQIHSIGIESGINLSNQTGDVFNNSNYRLVIIEGFCYEFLFRNNYTLGMDMIYSQKGFIDKSTLNGNAIEAQKDIKFNYNYLSLPVKIGYTKGQKLIGFLKMGLCPSILLSAGPSIDIFDEYGNLMINLKNDVSKFDLEGSVEIGAGYVFVNHIELFSSVSYYMGLTTFTNSEYLKDGNLRYYGFSMVAGLKYRLGKNN